MTFYSDEQGRSESASMPYYVERYRQGADRWTEISTVGPIADELVSRIRYLASRKPRLSLLDAGCGRLGMSLRLRELISNVDITAIDFAKAAIVESEPELLARAAESEIKFFDGDFLEFNPERRFDVVLDLGLFHHLIPSDWSRYEERLDSVLEQDGTLFIRAFHPDDGNWDKGESGGHVRRGYYCHYHTLDSLRNALSNIVTDGVALARATHFEHVECLYQFRRAH